MKKRILSFLLATLMVCTMMSVMSFSVSAAHYEWPYNIDNFSFPAGTGAKFNPFIITNAQQFWMMSYCNYYGSSGKYGYFGCADCYNERCDEDHEHYFVLGNDITFEWEVWYGFYPIGCYNGSYAFNGHLDGQGHKIKNLALNPDDGKYWGLFGRSNHASFSNIVFENCNFTANSGSDNVRGNFSPVNYSGLLVGYAQDTTFENITFTGCKIDANSAVGLVCGQADNCRFKNIQIDNKCEILARSTEVGAVAGVMTGKGSISDSKVEAKVGGVGYIGGYVGWVIPSAKDSIWFNNVERGNQAYEIYTYSIFGSSSAKINSMGVFVGVADYGFTSWNIKNGTLYMSGKNPETVYSDQSGSVHNYFRWLGKSQTEAGGSYSELNFTTSDFSEKMIHNADANFKMPADLDISAPSDLEVNRPIPDGDYRIYCFMTTARGDRMYVDIDGSKGAVNAMDNVHLWDKGAAYNVFTITWDANTEAYIIRNKHSGLVLDVAGGSTENGANIQQWSDNGTDAQRWVFEPADDGSYYIRNKQYRYMEAAGCVRVGFGENNYKFPENDTNIQAWVLTKGSNQKFRVERANSLITGSVLSEGNKMLIIGIAAAVVFGLGGFFAGNTFAKKKTLATANGAPAESKNDEEDE